MKIHVRPAELKDAEAINALNWKVLDWYPAFDAKTKLARLLASERDRIFVAEMDGAIVGYIHASDYETLYTPHMKNILSLVVSPDHRRQGVGTALLSAVERWASVGGVIRIRMTLGEERTDAHAFYRSNGYQSVRREINFKKKPTARMTQPKAGIE